MIRALLIHHSLPLRESVRRTLESSSHIQVVKDVGTGQEGLQSIQTQLPDILILSGQLPDLTRANMMALLLNQHPKLPVLMIDLDIQEAASPDILNQGALGYCSTQASAEELIHAVKRVSQGQRFISHEIFQHIEPNGHFLTALAWLKPSKKRFSKTAEEIHTLEDVLSDLQYSLTDFPLAALKAAARYQQQITPILLHAVDELLLYPQKIKKRHHYAPFYALYLLAQFREKTLFPKLMAILKTRKKVGRIDGRDVLTYDIENILASTFNGHIELIYSLVEDSRVDRWVRSRGVETLVALYTVGEISYSTIIDYYRYLLKQWFDPHHRYLLSALANDIHDIYAHELFDDVKKAFAAGYIDSELICSDEFESPTESAKEAARIYRSQHYYIIEDAGTEILGKSFHPMAERIRDNIIIELWEKRKCEGSPLDFSKTQFTELYQPGRHYAVINKTDTEE